MATQNRALEGYVKTSSLYFFVMVAVFAGFIGGVLFSSYRSVGGIAAQNTSQPAAVPMSQEQSQLGCNRAGFEYLQPI